MLWASTSLEGILQSSNAILDKDPHLIAKGYQIQQKLLSIQSRRYFFRASSKTILNLNGLSDEEIQLLSILLTNTSHAGRAQLESILPAKSSNPKDEWMTTCFHLLKVGTVKATKIALGCLAMALLNTEEKSKPILDVAKCLVDNDLPELAIPLIAIALKDCKITKILLQGYMLVASALKLLAEQHDKEWEDKVELLEAAKEACSLADQSLGKSMEAPKLMSATRNTDIALDELVKQKSFNNGLLMKILSLWSVRNYKGLLSFITTRLFGDNKVVKAKTIEAIQDFMVSYGAYVDKMKSDDQATLLLLRGLVKIEQKNVFFGLADIEKAA